MVRRFDGRMAFVPGDSTIVARHEVPGLESGHFPKAWMWAESGLPNGPYPKPVQRATFLELGFVSR
jgi:hypothetical protein